MLALTEASLFLLSLFVSYNLWAHLVCAQMLACQCIGICRGQWLISGWLPQLIFYVIPWDRASRGMWSWQFGVRGLGIGAGSCCPTWNSTSSRWRKPLRLLCGFRRSELRTYSEPLTHGAISSVLSQSLGPCCFGRRVFCIPGWPWITFVFLILHQWSLEHVLDSALNPTRLFFVSFHSVIQI